MSAEVATLQWENKQMISLLDWCIHPCVFTCSERFLGSILDIHSFNMLTYGECLKMQWQNGKQLPIQTKLHCSESSKHPALPSPSSLGTKAILPKHVSMPSHWALVVVAVMEEMPLQDSLQKQQELGEHGSWSIKTREKTIHFSRMARMIISRHFFFNQYKITKTWNMVCRNKCVSSSFMTTDYLCLFPNSVYFFFLQLSNNNCRPCCDYRHKTKCTCKVVEGHPS